jgi:hypothetical protein
MYNSKDFPAIHPVFCDLIPLSRYFGKRCCIFIRITALLKFRSGFCHFSQKFLFIRVRYTLMSIRSTFFRKVFRLFLYLIKITAVSIVNRLQCTLLASCVLFTLFYIMQLHLLLSLVVQHIPIQDFATHYPLHKHLDFSIICHI